MIPPIVETRTIMQVIREKYHKIDQMMGVMLKGRIPTMFVIGRWGIGKTHNIMDSLTERNVSFVYIQGNVSPLALYRKLYENKDSVIFFDDTNELVQNPKSMLVAMSAMDNPTSHRIVSWDTTSKLIEDIGRSFEFEGRIIFSLNDIPDTTAMKTLLSRCLTVNLTFTHAETLGIMYNIAKLPRPDISADERTMLVNWIKANSTPANLINLRTQKRIEEIYIHAQDNWQELSREIVPANMDMVIARDLMSRKIPVKEQAKLFAERTDKSVRTYGRIRSELKRETKC